MKDKSIIIDKLKEKTSNKKLSGSYNKSTIFLYPLLNVNKSFISKNMMSLVNIYYHCEEDLEYDNNYKDRIYCVFKKEGFDPVKAANIYNTEQFIGLIERDEYLIFVFKVPEEHIQDYELFKKGMFSKFSPSYKAKIIVEYPLDIEYLKSILYPSDKDIEQLSLFLNTKESIKEVYSAPNSDDEIFKLSNFYKIKK